MKILVVGRFYQEGFALHIAETLTAMEHSVARFEPGLRMGRLPGVIGHRMDQARGVLHAATDNFPGVRRHRMSALWEAVDHNTPDIAIVCHDFLWPEEVAELKWRAGCPVAMWFPDSLINFGKGYFFGAPYDALFFKDPYIVATLAGVTTGPLYYLPECFNPERHFLPAGAGEADSMYECDITTAGNLHSYRVAVFRHLANYNVRLWGRPFPKWMTPGPVGTMYQRRPVLNEEKARAFRSAKIVLNNMHYGEIWGLNVRAFEIAGIGAFQLLDWRPGLAQLFVDGVELVTYRGIRDLLAQLDYWLPRAAERQVIAAAGQRRAQAHHTYRHRLTLLLETLAGRAAGFDLPAIEWRN